MEKTIDLTGKNFGKIKVLGIDEGSATKNKRWICLCECGNKISRLGQGLRNGETKHCGCVKSEFGPKDIAGKKFGRLTAVVCTGLKNEGGNFIWEFACDCGNKVVQPSGNIVFRKSASCGCLQKEVRGKAQKTHGMSKTKEYKSWCKAKERTGNPNCKSYADYGAIGIHMSDDFYNSFEKFIEHIGYMPLDGKRYTLGRISNDGGYCANNVRWETDEQQARNKGFQSNNSSGFSGVTWDSKSWKNGIKLYAKAQCNTLTGSVEYERFSVEKFGLLPAFAMACARREKMIEELNEQGAGYSPTHGK